MVDLEVYRKIGYLLLSAIVTFILYQYELIIVEFILLLVAFIELFINIKLYKLSQKVHK